MLEYKVMSAGVATANSVPKNTMIVNTREPLTIPFSSHADRVRILLHPGAAEDYADRQWDEALNSAHGQRTLDFLLEEVYRERLAGEFEEGGFGLE